MYCNSFDRGKKVDPCFRMSKKHISRKTGRRQGGSRLALSTDVKLRLKWTADLHRRFVEAVNQLGGPAIATPKSVMRVMSIPGLTLYHLKSHLQKYRLSRNVHGKANGRPDRTLTAARERVADENGPYIGNHENMYWRRMHVDEARQIQFETQRQYQAQLEVQHHLLLRIVAQGRYLKSVMEKAQETLGRHNLDMVGLEAARFQLSELIAEVSDQRLGSVFSDMAEFHEGQPKESWLVTGEGGQNSLDLREGKDMSFHEADRNFFFTGWTNGKKTAGMQFLSASATPQRSDSMNQTEVEGEQLPSGQRPHFLNEKPDLNLCDKEERLERKELNLNGFSWS